MAHSSDIARVRKYLASDFHAIHGVHPYCMRPDRFRQLHGFSQAAARAMGMYPDSGDSIFEVPPLPYAPPPTPWTDYVPGVYRTSARFRPEAAPEGDAECYAKTLLLNGSATWRQLQRLYDMLPVTVPTRACQDQTGPPPTQAAVSPWVDTRMPPFTACDATPRTTPGPAHCWPASFALYIQHIVSLQSA